MSFHQPPYPVVSTSSILKSRIERVLQVEPPTQIQEKQQPIGVGELDNAHFGIDILQIILGFVAEADCTKAYSLCRAFNLESDTYEELCQRLMWVRGPGEVMLSAVDLFINRCNTINVWTVNPTRMDAATPLPGLWIRTNKQAMLASLRQFGVSQGAFMNIRLFQDRDFVLAAVRHAPNVLRYMPQYADDLAVIEAAVNGDANAVKYASARLRRANKDLVFKAVYLNGLALEHIPEYNGDSDVVKAAIAHKPTALQFASVALRGDREIVMFAVSRDVLTFRWASMQLQTDREMFAAVAMLTDLQALQNP
jgi:hypothetical protein